MGPLKRFQFQLEPVLNYKQQALDALMIELGAAQDAVHRQEAVRDEAARRLEEYAEEYEQRKQEGLTVADALKYQGCLDVLRREVAREEARLQALREAAERKRLEVVSARQDTMSLEKLRDMRRREHAAAEAKEQEKTLDDLTIARRLAAASA